MLASLAVAGIALKVKKLKAAAPRVKIGACDWTLGKRTDPAALEIAKRIGLDGIMVDVGNWKQDLPLRKPEIQKKYLEMSKEIGLPVSSLALSVHWRLICVSDTAVADSSVGAAAHAGVPSG